MYSINLYEIENPLSDGDGKPKFADCSRDPLCSNDVCNEDLPNKDRADALIAALKIEEKLNNLANDAPGVPRLGIKPYNWWTEALHGLASSPGTSFASNGEFSFATSFPQPILTSAAFDDDLVRAIGDIIGTEVRAFNNAGRTGLNVFVSVTQAPLGATAN